MEFSEATRDRSAAAEAEEFLRDKLSGGPVCAKEGEDHARVLGIAPRTLARARKKLGVVAEKGGLKEGWTWRLLPEDCQTPLKNANKSNGSLRPALAAFDRLAGAKLPGLCLPRRCSCMVDLMSLDPSNPL